MQTRLMTSIFILILIDDPAHNKLQSFHHSCIFNMIALSDDKIKIAVFYTIINGRQ